MRNKMKALTFSKFGGPDVLEYIDVPMPRMKASTVLVRMKAIGLNYADIYRRKGNYHLEGKPPFIAGYEGAGVIVKSNIATYKIGDAVAFADVEFANAEFVCVPEENIIPLSHGADFTLAASVLLQGLTAQYLANDSHVVKTGETVLIHAASGGVGQILTQICKFKGAEVIGLTRDAAKRQIISDNGADYSVILDDNWPEQVNEITNMKGVDVVYDSVGSTLMDSFAVTKDCGHVVFFGMSGGDPNPIDPRMLMDTSKTLSGGDLWSYLTSAKERCARANQLFSWIANGHIKIKDPVIFNLSEGQQAHEFLESGKSSGKVLLVTG